MGSICSTLKEFHVNMQQRMDFFENEMCHMRSQISEIGHPDPEINFNENRPQINNSDLQSLPQLTTSNFNTDPSKPSKGSHKPIYSRKC